jgi:hypothetical protein
MPSLSVSIGVLVVPLEFDMIASTNMVPSIHGCTIQWYGNTPSVVGTHSYEFPVITKLESNTAE